MKKVILLIAVLLMGIGSAFAQVDSTAADKSSTISALCDAQEEVVGEVLTELYDQNGKVDVVKSYEAKIKPRIAECLYYDMIETGIKIQNNALEGKFKKIKLRFEKPEDNTFKVSSAVKRKYKRAYKKFKREFPETRKGKTLDEIMGDKNLAKKVDRVAKRMTREFNRNVRKVSK